MGRGAWKRVDTNGTELNQIGRLAFNHRGGRSLLGTCSFGALAYWGVVDRLT